MICGLLNDSKKNHTQNIHIRCQYLRHNFQQKDSKLLANLIISTAKKFEFIKLTQETL